MSVELRTVLEWEGYAPLWQAYTAVSGLNWRELMLSGIAAGMEGRAEWLYLSVCRPYLEPLCAWNVPAASGETGRFLGKLLQASVMRLSDCLARVAMRDRGDKLLGSSHAFPIENEAFLGLERVARAGWLRVIPAFANGVDTGVETVAEHSVKTAFLAGLLDPDSFGWTFLMGLVHDQAELVIGDLTPEQVNNRAHKNDMECRAYEEMLEHSGLERNVISRLRQAFFECMEDKTRSARCVHIADKLDMAMQAMLYERQAGICLEEFLVSSENVFRNYMLNDAI